MQVNSAQDYLTMRKRQIIAATFYSTPAPREQDRPSDYLSVMANNATIRQRFITPTASAWGSVPGTATYTNFCTSCEASSGAPGTFTVVNTKDTHKTRIFPMSVHAGIVG